MPPSQRRQRWIGPWVDTNLHDLVTVGGNFPTAAAPWSGAAVDAHLDYLREKEESMMRQRDVQHHGIDDWTRGSAPTAPNEPLTAVSGYHMRRTVDDVRRVFYESNTATSTPPSPQKLIPTSTVVPRDEPNYPLRQPCERTPSRWEVSDGDAESGDFGSNDVVGIMVSLASKGAVSQSALQALLTFKPGSCSVKVSDDTSTAAPIVMRSSATSGGSAPSISHRPPLGDSREHGNTAVALLSLKKRGAKAQRDLPAASAEGCHHFIASRQQIPAPPFSGEDSGGNVPLRWRPPPPSEVRCKALSTSERFDDHDEDALWEMILPS